MKKNPLLLVLLSAFALTVSSCNNDDEAPAPPPVVGVWELDRYEIADLPAAFSQFNGIGYDNRVFFQGSRLNVKTDKTFDEVSRSEGYVFDSDGTWEFANNELDLNYTDTDLDDLALTYDPAKMRLYGEKFAISDSLPNTSTNRMELVRFNIQPVYIKN